MEITKLWNCGIVSQLALMAFFLLFSSCADVAISEQNQSLAQLRGAVLASLPMGKREISVNGREFFSKYYTLKDDIYINADKSRVRFYAHIIILGDRRPYDIQVNVIREFKTSKQDAGRFVYEKDGKFPLLEKRLIKELRYHLAKGRDDRNMIDDFRVF